MLMEAVHPGISEMEPASATRPVYQGVGWVFCYLTANSSTYTESREGLVIVGECDAHISMYKHDLEHQLQFNLLLPAETARVFRNLICFTQGDGGSF